MALICGKCKRKIPDNLLACRECAKIASLIQTKRDCDRAAQLAFDQVLRGVQPLWKQRCRCAEPTVHLAFQVWIEFVSVAFCGHEITMGACNGDGGQSAWTPGDESNEKICPLCLDRLLHKGGGICANVCLNCGYADGRHAKGCLFKPLQNKALVAKLGGLVDVANEPRGGGR